MHRVKRRDDIANPFELIQPTDYVVKVLLEPVTVPSKLLLALWCLFDECIDLFGPCRVELYALFKGG